MADLHPLANVGTRTPITQSLVARLTSAARYVVSGAGEAWMGPQQPLAPLADAPENQTRGRAFDYQVGQNLQQQPRANEPVTFPQLRALADGLPILRTVIETRKDQMARLKWKIVNIDETKPADARCEAATAFFQQPDKFHDWHDWLRMLLEEMLVTDAATIYPRPTVGGKLYGFDLVDGATIKRVIDGFGRTPMAPAPAYQQVLKGLPAVDYSADELVYRPRNGRVSRLYGYSPVEQIMLTINIALRREANTLSYYTDGNTPNLIFAVPDTWNPDQIKVFQEWFDSVTTGQSKHKSRFVPGGTQPFDTKAAALKDEMDEWLARIVCFAFSISPTPFVKSVNRATAETAHQQSLEEGLAPVMLWVKSTIDLLIAKYLGFADLRFAWDEEESIDPLVQAQISQIYVAAKVLHPDEIRAGLGRDPLTPEQRDEMTPPAPVVVAPPVDGTPVDNATPAPDAEKLAKAVKKKTDFDTTAAKLGDILTAFLAAQAPKIAAQLGKALALGKSAAMDDGAHQSAFDAADEVQFDWSPLVKKIKPGLVIMAVDSGGEALDSLGLFAPDVMALMTKDATKAASDRAAELVGMKWVDGALVTNPDARWAITDATRDMIRSTATSAVEGGWSNQRLAAELKDTHAFSAERAINIARTETNRAQTDGSLAGWRATGVVGGKKWSAGADCCDICQELDGLIVALDDEFPDGDPPLHPSCRCGLDAVLFDDMEATDGK